MKKQGKKWMLVVLALLAVVTVALPLVGCKNDTIAEPVRYTVKFSKGSDTVDETDKEEIEAVTLPADLTVVSGTKLTAEQLKKLDDTTSYTFYGWHDGETKVEEGYEVKKDVTLTAQWTKKETGPGDQGSGDGNQGTGDGTGSGDGNQGTGDGTGSGSGNQGTGDGTGSGSGNQGSGDPEQPVTYTVSFDTNGGGSIDSQPIVSGQTATKPADPTLENNVFGGWYSDAEFSKPYDFTTPVTGSFTLYAKWVERIEVTADYVSTVISGLTGDGSYILVVTGELNDLSAIKTALDEKPNAKVNLDLSKVSGLTEIGPEAFKGCSGLTSISIPEGVEIIGGDAFYECRGLTSISIPSSVEFIGGGAFFVCKDLTSIDLSKATGLTTIGAGAFEGCRGLTSIDLSKATGLTTIRVGAFGNCRGLTSISIPSSVTSIEDDAFNSCSELTTVTMKATTPPELGSNAFSNTSTGLQILVPSGSEEAYWEAENWKEYSGKIKAIPDQTS